MKLHVKDLAIVLAVVISALYIGFVARLPVEASGSGPLLSDDDRTYMSTEPRTYIVVFEDPAVPDYLGGVGGYRATDIAVTGGTQLDARAPSVHAYRTYLRDQQASFTADAEEQLGHRLNVMYQYQLSLNGMAVRLTESEARRLAKMDGVLDVVPDWVAYPQTDVGPDWIEADQIWAGVGDMLGTKGEGMIVGILDTGINYDHPSFSADPADYNDGYTYTWDGDYLGWCDPNGENYTTTVTCNDKLVGLWSADTDTPDDYNGHGSHVASTVAGNYITATVYAPTAAVTRPISGVAPHAHVIGYNIEGVQGEGAATGAGIIAATEAAIEHGVDVINYSFGSSGADPWVSAWHWLNVRKAGIFVATSAGNEGPGAGTIGSPANAPWMMTVGSASHTRKMENALIDMTPGGPADMLGKGFTAGYGPAEIVYGGWYSDTIVTGTTTMGFENASQCLIPFPAGTFNGEIVVCDRGQIARVAKAENVAAGGAGGFVLVNVDPSVDWLSGDAYVIPGVHLAVGDGIALKGWLTNTVVQTATIQGYTMNITDTNADIVNASSSRGPNFVEGVLKPDVTAPGVDILAAVHTDHDTPAPYPEFDFYSGTSMASPHVAGAAVLIKALHPGWTPAEIQSALTSTADNGQMRDEDSGDVTPFDTGAGSVRADNAALAGLLLDETYEDFVAADPRLDGDPTTLNLATLANGMFVGECTWERTLRSALAITATWEISVVQPATATLSVQPTRFTLFPGDEVTITVTADVMNLPVGQWDFGALQLMPDITSTVLACLPVAVQATMTNLPEEVIVETQQEVGAKTLEDIKVLQEITAMTIRQTMAQAEYAEDYIAEDDNQDWIDDFFSKPDFGNLMVMTYTVSALGEYDRLVAEVITTTSPDLDLFIIRDKGWYACQSATGATLEYCSIAGADLITGTYHIVVHNYKGSGTSGGTITLPDRVVMGTGLLQYEDPSELAVTAPDTVAVAAPFDVQVGWDVSDYVTSALGVEPPYRWYGVFDMGPHSGSPGDIGTTSVDLRYTPEPPSYILYHTVFYKDYYSHTATLHLQNPSDKEATSYLNFYGADGTTSAAISRTLPAKGTLILPSNDITELSVDWIGSLIVSADQPVQSVVEVHRPGSGDTLAMYEGVAPIDSCPPGETCVYYRYFGPFFGNASMASHYPLSMQAAPTLDSNLTLMNAGSSPATLVVQFYNLDGTVETSLSPSSAIPTGGQYTLNPGDIPVGFIGWAIVSSDQPLVGLLRQLSLDGTLFNLSHSLGAGGDTAGGDAVAYFPRAMKHWDEVGDSRTTALFIGNAASMGADATLSYYAGDGTQIEQSSIFLSSWGGELVDLSDEFALPDGNIWANVLRSTGGIVMGELTYYDTASSYATGGYGALYDCPVSLGGGASAYHLCLAYVARDSQAYTVFSVQNLGASQATVSITYYDKNGTVILTENDSLAAYGWARYDQSQQLSLGDNFVGSVVIQSDQPIAAWVDKYAGAIVMDSDRDGIPDSVECPDGPVCPDSDGDGTPNYLDVDSDGDGFLDANECSNALACADTDSDGVPDYVEPNDQDTDGDGKADYEDADDDGDGIPTADECLNGGGICPDANGDGIPDYLDDDDDGDGVATDDECPLPSACPDTDADGMPDYLESNTGDTDGDGTPDYQDTDDDGDGIPTADECAGSMPAGVACPDTDGDGIPNYLDDDDDGDGIDTETECPDPAACTDTDGDGVPDYMESNTGDTDGDGTPDYQDTDDDGDGIPTEDECPNGPVCPDVDGDGVPDYLDSDADGDGIQDTEEAGCTDTDGDGVVDSCPVTPTDTDEDGIPDYLEPNDEDTDGDGKKNHEDNDDDGDSVPTATECPDGPECPDGDGDGVADYLDDDDDDDGLLTKDEYNDPNDPTDDFCSNLDQDSDEDGTPDCQDNDADGDQKDNYLDTDSDGDGLLDSTECPAGTACPDSDGNGVPDHLDPVDMLMPQPVEQVTIAGPASGYINTTYRFTSAVRPITAATPISYTWTPAPAAGQGTSRATYVWTAAGTRDITLVAQNAAGIATDTHAIAVQVPPNPCPTALDNVTLLGPSKGYTGTVYAFTAVISPSVATLPFTYTWTPRPQGGGATASVTYTWDAPGTYPITVSVANCGATVVATETITIRPRPVAAAGDDYEPDDVCAVDVPLIPTDGTVQHHTFHAYADEDWVAFNARGGITYVIAARVPPPFVADLTLELYEDCSQAQGDQQAPAFSPEVRFVFSAPTTGTYYLRLRNDPPAVYGEDVVYDLAVRALGQQAQGALVVVAGKLKADDPVQAHIHNVTQAAYTFARTNGCAADQVYYLASDTSLPNVNAEVNTETLKSALTTWAAGRVGPDYPLTLFMMDHGDRDTFYLNGSNVTLTADQLDTWLTQLETQTGAGVNVVIEACHSGSFIDAPQSVSKDGRVVIASTGTDALAYASQRGAVFSDAFLASLEQGLTLREAFEDAAWRTAAAHPYQLAALDDNGNAIANDPLDSTLAAQRGFACAEVLPAQQFPPYVVWSKVKRLREQRAQGEIWAEVRDDREVRDVWAAVYPPSYQPQASGNEMVREPALRFRLTDQGHDLYGGMYTAFNEIGVYRVVVLAEDAEGLPGQPKVLRIAIGGTPVYPGEAHPPLEIPVGGYTITLNIPSNAISETITLVPTAVATVTTAPPDHSFAGRAFDLTAYQWGQPQPGFTFQHPITFTIPYSDDNVAGLDEEKLALWWRDGEVWSQEGLTVTQRLTTTNALVVQATHLTEFALFGQKPGYRVYLPVVLRK